MALSPDEKFIYVNPDTTSGEYNTAQYFPVKYLRGLECALATHFYIYFRGPKDATSTRVTVSITSGFIKDFFIQFVDEVNFGENAVITLADRNASVDATTGGTDFQHVNAFVVPVILSDVTTSGHEDVQVAEDLDVAGTITGNLTGDVTGNADTATALATARAINGVDFDGTGAITITAAGSTLSDTVPVSKGGTGATSLTTDGVLFGNGTSAVSAVDLSSSGNIVVGGSTPAAVTGANLAGSGLAATVGNGTLVLAVETLNQDTTGSAATLTTPRAINGVDFDGSAPITVTSAGSTLSDTVTVAKGGTGLTTVGTNNILTGNGTGALQSEANLRYDDSTLRLFSTGSGKPKIDISSSNTTKDTQPKLILSKTATGEDGENIGSIDFNGTNDDDTTILYAQILGEISDATDGDDGGKLTLSVSSHDATLVAGLVIEDGDASGEVDATIGAGAASVTTVAGTLTMGSTAALTNAGLVAVANQSNITGVGTISSGVWEGTDVGVAHGGTGLSTVGTNEILTGNGTGALTSESNLTFNSNRLIIGADAEITPQLRLRNDENTVNIAIADVADNIAPGTVDGDFVIDCSGDHNVIITQNNAAALTIDTNGDSNFNRRFTVTGNTDGTYEGDVVYFGGTTSMTIGTIYHYKSDGTWEQADADAVATCDGLLGVALGAASDTNGMLLRGMVTLDHDPGAVGDVLFLSTTAGDATATAPSGNNNIVRVLGYCLNASNGQIWFNPDSTFVEVTA
jgi:hypothetical protein